MSACTFFGHRDCPIDIKPKLKKAIVELINMGIEEFYVGDKGAFDLMTISVLQELSQSHPDIKYSVVLAYLPQKNHIITNNDFLYTIYPEGIEGVPPRFAISWRNKWMLRRSDWVICYVKYTWGGAVQFVNLAKKQGKTIINLAELL